jgi:hypothetical protein
MPITPPLVPTTGTAAATITVNGSGFTGMTGVLLNGATCAFAFVSDVQFTFTVPSEGGGAKDLTVQFGAAATGVGTFSVDSASTGGGGAVGGSTVGSTLPPAARPVISARYAALLKS